jgi:hypothetical protein
MSLIDFPIERINKFLESHSFEIQNPLGSGLNRPISLTVKLKLTGVKPMISVGEWKDFIEYTLYLEDIDYEFGHMVLNQMFENLGTNDYKLLNTDTTFFILTTQANQILHNFLLHFSLDYYTTCTRIVNNLGEYHPKNMNEGLIKEGKYDSMTRQLVKDVLSVFKYQKEGLYHLPEDINEGQTYDFPVLDTNFTIELYMELSDEVETVDVDGAFYPEDDVIEISIVSNPNFDRELLEELHFELNELIRHEVEHIVQLDRGDKLPKKEPKRPLKYYTQEHELSAQLAGFKRRAQKERKPLEDVIRDWFKKNRLKHKLSPKNTEIVINRLLELA